MRMSTQRYRPDTCGCSFLQTWDRDNPPAQFTAADHVKLETKCHTHSSVPDEQVWGVVRENVDSEQLRKNLLHKALMEESDLGLTDDGRDMRTNLEFVWSFEGEGADRTLVYDVVDGRGDPVTLDETTRTRLARRANEICSGLVRRKSDPVR